MPITNTVNTSELYHDLKGMERDNFSYEGAKALMEYLEQLADDCEMNIEYDPIAFCCEYSEYGDAVDCIESCQYPYDFDDDSYNDKEEQALEYLRDNTTVIEFNGGIIIQDF